MSKWLTNIFYSSSVNATSSNVFLIKSIILRYISDLNCGTENISLWENIPHLSAMIPPTASTKLGRVTARSSLWRSGARSRTALHFTGQHTIMANSNTADTKQQRQKGKKNQNAALATAAAASTVKILPLANNAHSRAALLVVDSDR